MWYTETCVRYVTHVNSERYAELIVFNISQDNILVDEDENVYISDFGLAVYAQAGSTKYGSSRGGNVRWLAPELIDPEQFGSDSTRPTFASDIYSLGCLCVEVRFISRDSIHMSDHMVLVVIDRSRTFPWVLHRRAGGETSRMRKTSASPYPL